MVRTIMAHTSEIDDLDAAVADIKSQISFDELLKNTVAIITCHYEFVLSGAMKAICESMPFPCVGTITSAQAVNSTAGVLLLSLMIMTSDDVSFDVVMTETLLSDPCGAIEKAYIKAADEISVRPSLILAFAPFLMENSGDEYVDTITKVSGGVPVFGTLSVDDTPDLSECYMLNGGEHYKDRMAMILFSGDISPKFFMATISDDKILDKPALVTASEGHVLKELNGRPITEYFESLGLTKASETNYAMASLPFMVDYNDGTPPVSKVFIGLDENKYGICAGAMPVGSTLTIGMFDKEDVLQTSRRTLCDAIDRESLGALLAYSCISRNMSLGGDLMAELELVRGEIGEKVPFMMACSGGEICPTRVSESKAINRFHNNTFVVCVI